MPAQLERLHPMAVEFGFNIPQGADWNTLRAFAQTAERIGIDHVWGIDHMFLMPPNSLLSEGWTAISMVAAATEDIRVGHQVLCQSFRNPALLANMVATLDYLSSGRVIFGIGAGWFPMEYEAYGWEFPPIAQRLREFRECVEICKAMWTEESPTYAGKHYSIEDAHCYPRPAQTPHPPIMIGGAGEKVMLKIVAEHANIWNNFQTYIGSIEQKLDILKDHCDTVGRDFAEIQIAQQTSLILGGNEADAKAKLDTARSGSYLDDPEATGVWGHPQRVIDEIGRHVDRGITLFNFNNTGERSEDGGAKAIEDIGLFASEVLPAFR